MLSDDVFVDFIFKYQSDVQCNLGKYCAFVEIAFNFINDALMAFKKYIFEKYDKYITYILVKYYCYQSTRISNIQLN